MHFKSVCVKRMEGAEVLRSIITVQKAVTWESRHCEGWVAIPESKSEVTDKIQAKPLNNI